MNVKNFNQFLNEDVKIPVLDVVIDEFGHVYNGQFDNPLIKGNLVLNRTRKLVNILGQDNKLYPIGIDKNGFLQSIDVDDDGYALIHDKRIPIPDDLYDKLSSKFVSKFWRVTNDKGDKIDYSFLIPIVATGWVNVKIDMEIVKRVRRYSRGLGTNNRGFNSFVDKLNDLKRMSTIQLRKRSRETIQKEMSVIIILHYIEEIKNFFTPSGAGFLFESFIAGLIPGGKVMEDNSKVDIYANGEMYQIKLYSNIESSLSVAFADKMIGGISTPTPMDHYIIGLKYPDKIDIFILNNSNQNEDDYYRNFMTPSGKFSVSKIKSNCPENMRFSVELINIDEKINSIARGLQNILDNLYKELSDFQYNVETIVTGVDQHGKIINEHQFNDCSNNALGNLVTMDKELRRLLKDVLWYE